MGTHVGRSKKNHDFPECLEPCEALFGGRTNAINLHYIAKQDEKIDYYDFTSLYPYVNKVIEYPIGHPQVIFRDFKPVGNYFGFIKAKIYSLQNVFLPVLPYRAPGKLMFLLCRTCCISLSQNSVHSNDERALSGVWCSVELEKAIEKGYRVTKMYEVWHFAEKNDSLFTDYIKTFLQGKQESSVYPSWVSDDASKERYIQEYFVKEDIQLELEKIIVNQAKRQISKLFLNSLWWKFGQRLDKLKTTLIRDPEQLLQYMFSNEYNISHFSFLSQDVAIVQWRYSSKYPSKPGNVNDFIAAFTTAYAKLELYNVMDKLERRVLNHDTDSVVFVSKPGDWMPELSDFLDGLTGVLDPQDHITEFVSGGPKTYGYRTLLGKTCMKAKGITLHHANDSVVNLESLTSLGDHFVHDRGDPREVINREQKIV